MLFQQFGKHLVFCAVVFAPELQPFSDTHQKLGNGILAFTAGLAAIYVTIASPLDAFAGLLLQIHMIQHLVLMMLAPPLILAGAPYLPILSGLPRWFTREVLGPLLVWKPIKRIGRTLAILSSPGPLSPSPIFSGISHRCMNSRSALRAGIKWSIFPSFLQASCFGGLSCSHGLAARCGHAGR